MSAMRMDMTDCSVDLSKVDVYSVTTYLSTACRDPGWIHVDQRSADIIVVRI
jgi:hypothetical protein